MKRTTNRSGTGKKVHAVRGKTGTFKENDTYKRTHGLDAKRKGQTKRSQTPKSPAPKPAKKNPHESVTVEFTISQEVEKKLYADLTAALQHFRTEHKLVESAVWFTEKERKEGLAGEVVIAYAIAVAAGLTVELIRRVVILLLKKYRGKIL